MAGTFRLKTNQSHTRFEGPKKDIPVRYHGNGHPKAKRIGGDLIFLTDDELRRFGDKARQRFDLMDGDWHDEPDTFDVMADAIPAMDEIDKLLAARVEDIEAELPGFDAEELSAIRAREMEGKARKGVLGAIADALADLGDDGDDE